MGQPHFSMRRPTKALLLAVLAVLAPAFTVACGGESVVLGQAAPKPLRFSAPKLVMEIYDVESTDNPTLTDDRLEIYFTSSRVGSLGGDLWRAKRASVALPFDAPEPLTRLNSDGFESSSAISGDGLTLWFGSDRVLENQMSIWVARRPSRSAEFGLPELVAELDSEFNDVPRPLGQRASVMPVSSNRDGTTGYRTYLARRSEAGVFGPPKPIPELAFVDKSTTDAWLSPDGLMLLFSSGPFGPPEETQPTADLYVAFRKSLSQPFSVVNALSDLNTASDERDPFLCADGSHFYFTSSRDGDLAVYESELLPN